MGIAILVVMGGVAAAGVFAFLVLTRGSRRQPRHVRGVRGYDAGQFGALWGGGSAGWSAGHGGFDGGGGGSCGDGGGGGSC